MRLFISYSRDDKAWVYELWRALRDEAQHDAWIDQGLAPAQEWWQTILENIEGCQCFIYVLSPKAAISIYCGAELAYALALNKPVLPLMLKAADYPSQLTERRISYQRITDDMTLDRVLYKIEQALYMVEIGLIQNKYPARQAPRPPVPTPEKKPEQVAEVFWMAEDAAAENNASLAEMLFRQVIDVDPSGWGTTASKRLAQIRLGRERTATYLNLVQMARNPALAKGAQAAAQMYVQKFGWDYDPRSILPGLLKPTTLLKPPK